MLRQDSIGPIPNETRRVAEAAFPDGNRYVRLGDELGTLFTDALFSNLYPERGQPALPPWRLALVTMLQFAEGLSDRQAAAAVRSRIDWKYLLRLELTDPGFDYSVLSEFRTRLLLHEADYLLFDHLISCCRERGLVIAGGRQRTDSTHILAAVRALNRIEVVGETLRFALNRLAVVAPAWLEMVCPREWAKRYAHRAEDDRLPTTQAARELLALAIGQDGHQLLTAVYSERAPDWLRHVPAVEILRRVWIQNYTWNESVLVWRDGDNIPPSAQFIGSPYDIEAHYSRKQALQWIGYKIHVTESCDDERPHLITHIETTTGPVPDGNNTAGIHQALQQRELLPKTHLVDTGYLDAELLVHSQEQYGVDLYGPTRKDYRWQAQAGEGFAAEQFHIDWEQRQVTCPAGKRSESWSLAVDKRGNEVVKVKFSSTDCRHCPHLTQCVRSKKPYPRRTLSIRREQPHKALVAARQRERTRAFKHEYRRRAGIEGTLSRSLRVTRLRRTRYIGLDRVRLGHILTGLGVNALRLGEWFLGLERPKSRVTPFMRLMAGATAA